MKPFCEWDDMVVSNEDNLDFMARLPDASVHLVLTSPPYNIGKEYESRIGMTEYLATQERVITEAARVLAPTGSICWQVGNHVSKGEVVPLDIVLYPIFKRLGLLLRNRIVWTYGHGLHAQKRFSGRHETVLWFTREEYHFDLDAVRVPSRYPNKRHYKGARRGELSGNPLGKNPGDMWDIPNVKQNHVEKTAHPCQFPLELAERLVLALTQGGDTVLDPYAGSGTTIVAAALHGRRGYGCEVSGDYVEIAQTRMQQLRDGALPIRPMGEPRIFSPGRVV